MRLLDKKRNVPVEVADELINEALASGNYAPRPGVRLPVVLPDGRFGEIDSDELPSAIGMGVRYRTAADDQARADKETEAIKAEAYDKPGTAFALGAARGATLGLSDVAIRGVAELTGQEGALEAAREIGERSPTASLAGEIAGGVGAFVTPAGALGAVGRVAGAPVRAATNLGEKLGAKLVAGADDALSVTQKIGRSVIGGATEGALIGAGQTLSEASLADPELTTQKALTNIGLGAIFGGALSGAGRGAFEGARIGVTKGLSQAAKTELLTKPAEVVAGKLAEMYGATSAAIKRIDDPAWNKAFDSGSKEFREAILDASANPAKVLEDVANQFKDIRSFSDDLRTVANEGANIQGRILDAQTGRAPKKALELLDDDEALEFGVDAILKDRVVKGPNLVQAEKEAGFEVFDRIQQAGRNLTKEGDEILSKMRTANDAERSFGRSPIYDDATIRDFAGRLEDFSKSTSAASRPSEIAQAMTTFKNETALLFKIPKGKTKDIIKVENRPLWETVNELGGYWKKLKETTVSREVFGDLGSAMAVRADAISNVLTATDSLMGKFFRIKPGKTMNAREYVPDMAKIQSFIVNPDAARNEIRAEAIDEIKARVREAVSTLKPVDIKASETELTRLRKLMKKTEQLPTNAKGAANKDEKLAFLTTKVKDLSKQIDDARQFNANIESFKGAAAKRVDSFESAFDIAREKRQAILLLNRMESTTGKSLMGGFAGAGLAMIGEGAGVDVGPTGTGISIIGGLLLANPKTAMRYINALENAASGFDKMAISAAAKFRNIDYAQRLKKGLSGKVVPAARQALIRDKLKLESGERHDSDEKAFKAHRKKLGELQRDPEALFERVADSIGVEAAQQNPRSAIEAFSTINRGIEFLSAKMPKDPYPVGIYPSEYVPSRVELSQYADYAQAVTKPKILLKQIENGRINPRTVEAVKAVYPKMYEDLKAIVATELMQKKQMGYTQRVELGVLFGITSVKALDPAYLQTLQRIMSPREEQGQEQGQPAEMNRTQMVGFREMKISDAQQRA